MKGRKLIELIGSLLICLLGVETFAASKSITATRIRFKRGESSATVSGKLTSRLLKKAFLIGAKAGQNLYASIEAKTNDGLDFANFIVLDPSGKPIASESTQRIQLGSVDI